MFQHLLLPVDGPALSEAAFSKALIFASEARARVTVIRVIPEFHVYTYQMELLADTRTRFVREATSNVEEYLKTLAAEAEAADVPCETLSVIHDHPYEAIIQAAQDQGCDLIVMASHGRRGLQAVLIGSETSKVLTHSTIPVLVYR
ncbi:universal stress protein [Cupriavidus basilensis]